ncbi:hypothetical protein H5410_035919 [Solanum commersonii]|uniref:Uncharacterized protein n=1 Tax=Solanum commersonii TaxID=4109 RepID=A0A9J5Y473_SOLCO|nr:hypothetical protein H5410_035919 [Solanum commersonii]
MKFKNMEKLCSWWLRVVKFTSSGRNNTGIVNVYFEKIISSDSDWKIDFFNLLHLKGCEIFLDV